MPYRPKTPCKHPGCGMLVEQITVCTCALKREKDNTIIYCSNRYSLPIGTYTTQPEV